MKYERFGKGKRGRTVDASLNLKRVDGEDRLQIRISNLRKEDIRTVDYGNKRGEWDTVFADHWIKIKFSNLTGEFLLFIRDKIQGTITKAEIFSLVESSKEMVASLNAWIDIKFPAISATRCWDCHRPHRCRHWVDRYLAQRRKSAQGRKKGYSKAQRYVANKESGENRRLENGRLGVGPID